MEFPRSGSEGTKGKSRKGFGLPSWLCRPCGEYGLEPAAKGNKADAASQKAVHSQKPRETAGTQAKKPPAEVTTLPKVPQQPLHSAPKAQPGNSAMAQCKPEVDAKVNGAAKRQAQEQRGLAVKDGDGLLCCLFVRRPSARSDGCFPFRLAWGRAPKGKAEAKA